MLKLVSELNGVHDCKRLLTVNIVYRLEAMYPSRTNVFVGPTLSFLPFVTPKIGLIWINNHDLFGAKEDALLVSAYQNGVWGGIPMALAMGM